MCLFSSCITIDHTIAKDWYSVFCSIFRGTIICSVFTLLTCPKIARAREQTKKAAQHYFLLRRTYDSKNEPNIESKMHFFAPNSLATSFATQQQWGFQIQGEKCWETSWETRWPQAGRQIGSKVRDKVGDTVGDKGGKVQQKLGDRTKSETQRETQRETRWALIEWTDSNQHPTDMLNHPIEAHSKYFKIL